MTSDPLERQRFIAEVVMMKNRAGELGLWQTMHAFDAVTCAYGEEVVGHPARVITVDRERGDRLLRRRGKR